MFLGLEAVRFKMPDAPLTTLKYDEDDEAEGPYPFTALLLGTNGNLKPCWVIN